jgi:NhaA family Na+:H+ antiporter
LIGIFFFSFIAVKIGFGVLPKDLNWKLIAGAASLAGIGFTMSIFITNLAFSNVEIINASKLIIIIASVVSAISGLTILNLAAKK